MRILLTRPEADAQRSARRLQALGHETLVCPLIEITPTRILLPAGNFTALLATSAHAFDALHGDVARLHALPLHVVGARTAEAARKAGFTQIQTIAADAMALAQNIETLKGPPRFFLYLAGRERRQDLEKTLAQRGHSIAPCIVYDAHAATTFPDAAACALREKAIDAVLHFSPRSAALYVELAQQSGLLQEALTPLQIAISRRAADPLASAGRLAIAATPDLDAMVACL